MPERPAEDANSKDEVKTTSRTAAGPARDVRARTLLVVVALLAIATFLVFRPLAAPVIVGAWAAHLARPLFARLSRKMHGRGRAAGVLTAGVVVLLAAPIVLAVTTFVPAARALIEQVKGAGGGRGALAALVTNGGGNAPEGKVDLMGLAKDYGASAGKAAGVIAAVGAETAVGLFVFVIVFFAVLVDGERAYAWIRERAPVEPPTLRRFADAFHQAGRGLFVGTGLTALVQGILCGAIYTALGVPRAVLLGLLSAVGPSARDRSPRRREGARRLRPPAHGQLIRRQLSRPSGPRSRFRSAGSRSNCRARSWTVSSRRMRARPTRSISSGESVSASMRRIA
jgi:hypothetical protein